eukprot:jgi/Tetstr1/424253/TSEL_014822.t1
MLDDDVFHRQLVASSKLPKFVELLKFKGLSEGVKVLAVVSEVGAKELVVALPHGLRAHVVAAEASDLLAERLQMNAKAGPRQQQPVPALADLFTVGQQLHATVTNLSDGDGKRPRKRIDLSLRLRHANKDHGYTLELGVKGLTGFMRKKDCKEKVVPGMMLDAMVATFSLDPAVLSSVVTKQWDGLTLESLQVGALVQARITNVLKDGLVVAFLTFFSGTIDKFHLTQQLAAEDWATKYSAGQKLLARILFVDPLTKRVGLTLAKHLLEQVPAALPTLGSVYDSVIRRVDPSVGLLLELPGKKKNTSLAGFAHVSNIKDTVIKKLEKEYKPNQVIKARVIGQRPVDGIAVLSTKPDVVEQQLLSHADVKVGDMVKGTVASVEEYGLLVKLTASIKGVCPTMHMSESGSVGAHSKFKVGQKVSARVLSCDPAARKVTLTLKKQLLKMELPAITCLADAKAGTRAYGVPGEDPKECFREGQSVRPRVVTVDAATKRVFLTLRSKTDGDSETAVASALGSLHPGDLVQGEVERLEVDERGTIGVKLVVGSAGSTVRGLLPAAHLSDHPAGAAALGARLAVGSQLGELVVLELQPGRGTALVSRKASLRGAATSLPSALEDLAEGAIHPGYVASVTADAVYVRFLARLTARAGLSQLADTFVSDPQQHFQPGQSVRAQVVQIDVAHGKFGVTLKPSLTASKDKPPAGVPVHELKDYGVVCDLNGHEDLLGLVAHHQAADELTPGQQIAGRVLDVNKQDGILDLTLKPKLCKQPKKAAKAAKALPLGEKVEGVVELIKPDYVVVSLPDAHGALGFVPAKDYNLHLIDAHKHFSLGQKLSATVSCQASPETGGRLLLHLPLHTSPDTTPRSNAKGGRIQSGGVLNGQVANVHAMHAMVKLGDNLPQARLHISQIWDTDANAEADSNPLDEASGGAARGDSGGRGHGVLEVSMRPADVAGAKARRKPKVLGYADLRPGTCLRGFSQEIVGDHLWVALGPNIRGRLDLLDCGAEPEELAGAARLYKPGTPLRVHVVGVTGEGRRQHVDLSLREPGAAAAGTPPLAAGQLVVARVVAVQPDTGLQVQLPRGLDCEDIITDANTSVVGKKQECRCKGCWRARLCGRVLAVDAEGHADLSLRRSVGGWWDGCEADVGAPAAAGEAPPELTAAALAAGDDVKGYVRAVTAKGMFVNLSRRLQGRVKLSHLSDGFVDDPKAAFPAGSLVAGRVLGVEGGRVELTLKSPGAGGSRNALVDLEGLEVGQTVLGKVKRVEKFGVFVQLDRSTAAGLAHISSWTMVHEADFDEEAEALMDSEEEEEDAMEDAAAGIDDAEWASEISDETGGGAGDTFMSDSLSAAADMGWGEVVLGSRTAPAREPGGQEARGPGARGGGRRAELARLEGGAAPASKEAFEQAVMASPN